MATVMTISNYRITTKKFLVKYGDDIYNDSLFPYGDIAQFTFD